MSEPRLVVVDDDYAGVVTDVRENREIDPDRVMIYTADRIYVGNTAKRGVMSIKDTGDPR